MPGRCGSIPGSSQRSHSVPHSTREAGILMCPCRSPSEWLHHRCSGGGIFRQHTLLDLGPAGGPGRCTHRRRQVYKGHDWPRGLEGTHSPPRNGAKSSWSVRLLGCRRAGRRGCRAHSGCWPDRSVLEGWGERVGHARFGAPGDDAASSEVTPLT